MRTNKGTPKQQGIVKAQGRDHMTELDIKAIDLLLAKDGSKLSFHSIRLLKAVCRAFNEWIQAKGHTVTQDSILGYLEALRKKASAATYNAHRACLKRLLLAQPALRDNIELEVKLSALFKRSKSAAVDQRVLADDYLTREEIRRLLDYCRAGNLRRRKIGLIAEALFQTACRVQELLDVRLQDCQVNGTVAIRIRRGKGGKERTVYLSQALYAAIQEAFHGRIYLLEAEPRRKEGVLMPGGQLTRESVARSLRGIGKALGIEKRLHPHIFRHSYAMAKIHDMRSSAEAVARYLGHADVATTLRHYAHGSFKTAEEALAGIEEPVDSEQTRS